MGSSDFFLSANPAEPWSFYPFGLPALGLVVLAMIAVTLWTYLGHPQATGRRLAIVLTLRLLALVIALLTAVRPSVGIQEDPKLPSVLLIGIDLSESMSVPDELGNKSRIEAVRKILDKCEPTLDEMRTEQRVNVVFYAFGPPEFSDATGKYDPAMPAKFNRSDYATYLLKSFEFWQAERFVRGNLVIGDGQHNGAGNPEAEAARWRQAGRPVHTFVVGQRDTSSDAKDVAVTRAEVVSGTADGAVFVKTDFKLKVLISATPNYVGATVPIRVKFDTGSGYKTELEQPIRLDKEKDNEIELSLKAPEKPGEIKLLVEVPIESVPDDVAPSNNVIETYVQVTKEGMRVLLVNRLGFEHAAIRRALQADPRVDLYQVIRQTEEPPTLQEREDFDFDNRGYDVIIIGNVSARQLTTIDPALPAKIAEQVTKKGVGLLFTGGHASFLGTPGYPGATGWRGTKEIEEILPVDLAKAPPVPDAFFNKPGARYQFLPTSQNADHYLTRLGNTPAESAQLWGKLNDLTARCRFTGLSNVGTPKPTASIFAVASDTRDDRPAPLAQSEAEKLPAVMVGHQIGAGNRGRVLVMAAQDTLQWQKLGQPKANDGLQLHAKFWRQMVRWLAHQEDDDGAAFARPEWRRGPVGNNQTIRVGLKQPGGGLAKDPKFDVKIIAPGEDDTSAKGKSPVPDADGGFKLPYKPSVPGEYIVKVSATGTDAAGKEVKGEATARFLAYPEASDEMLKKAADPDAMKRLAAAGGGKAFRIEDLPAFLKELKSQPIEAVTPKPRYLPEWRREKSQTFLTIWLLLFVGLLGGEWALRRSWGLV